MRQVLNLLSWVDEANFPDFGEQICLFQPLHWPQFHIMFQTQKGSRRFKRIENRNGVFALLVSHKDSNGKCPKPEDVLLTENKRYIQLSVFMANVLGAAAPTEARSLCMRFR